MMDENTHNLKLKKFLNLSILKNKKKNFSASSDSLIREDQTLKAYFSQKIDKSRNSQETIRQTPHLHKMKISSGKIHWFTGKRWKSGENDDTAVD